MTDKVKKSDGPSCACGKADLYKEFLKNQKEEEKDDESGSSESKKLKKTK